MPVGMLFLVGGPLPEGGHSISDGGKTHSAPGIQLSGAPNRWPPKAFFRHFSNSDCVGCPAGEACQGSSTRSRSPWPLRASTTSTLEVTEGADQRVCSPCYLAGGRRVWEGEPPSIQVGTQSRSAGFQAIRPLNFWKSLRNGSDGLPESVRNGDGIALAM